MWPYRSRPRAGPTKWQNAMAAATLIVITAAVFAAGSLCGAMAPSIPGG